MRFGIFVLASMPLAILAQPAGATVFAISGTATVASAGTGPGLTATIRSGDPIAFTLTYDLDDAIPYDSPVQPPDVANFRLYGAALTFSIGGSNVTLSGSEFDFASLQYSNAGTPAYRNYTFNRSLSSIPSGFPVSGLHSPASLLFVLQSNDPPSPLNATRDINSPLDFAGFGSNALTIVFGDQGSSTVYVTTADLSAQFISASDVPEPGSWAMLVAGFLAVGTALRRNRRPALRIVAV